MLRRSRRVGFYGSESVARLERLAAHLPNLFSLRDKLRRSDEARNLRSMLDRLDVAAVVTDRTGILQHMTAAAEELLREGLVLTCEKNHLRARSLDMERKLHAAVRSCVNSLDKPDLAAYWRFRCPLDEADGLALVVIVTPLLWCSSSGGRAPAALVLITDPRRPPIERPVGFGPQFGLTPAESKVAVALCEGLSITKYSAAAGISVLTARTQLKRALAKTQSHSQSELVSLLLRHFPRTGTH